MDKGWMRAPRSTNEFREGVKRFIEFGFANSAEMNRIVCPCKVCGNAYWLRREEVFDHLVSDGFMAGYTSWIHHGEGMWSADPAVASSSQREDGSDSHDDIDGMLLDRFGMYDTRILGGDDGLKDELDIDADTYYKLVNDASKELYPGCKFSNLQFLVRLLNIKNIGGVSDDCFDELLSLIKDAQQMEKAPNLQQKRKVILSDKDMHKKPRKFQTPLQKGGLAVLKRGLEVGLISPQSTSMVAFATIQAADRKSKATDGQTLNDCVEVLVNTVFSKTTQLPHSQGNIRKLAAAVGRCVRWPRKNLEPLHDGSGDRRPPKEVSDKA